MKRKKREAFIMAAVAGSFAVSMTGPQDIWALGNNGGRSYIYTCRRYRFCSAETVPGDNKRQWTVRDPGKG